MGLSTGETIGLIAGAYFLFSQQQAAAQQAALVARASSPAAAATAGVTGLETSLFSALTSLINKPAPAPAKSGGGGGGLSPAGGAGAGRSAGGTQAVTPPEDFVSLNLPTDSAIASTSNPFSIAPPADLSVPPSTADVAEETNIVNSMVPTGSAAVPQFDPGTSSSDIIDDSFFD